MKKWNRWTFLGMAALLVACTTAPVEMPVATGTPTTIPTPASTPIPIDILPKTNETGEILRITGSGPDSSHTFVLDAETIARVKWEQTSTGDFTLSIRNLDPNQAGTAYARVLFEMISGPSSGFADFSFIAGQYQVDVEKSDGPWEVWIQSVSPKP